jgi:hypothetical protein
LAGVVHPVQVVVAEVGARLPSGSVSLAATLMSTAVLVSVVAVSSTATGGALTEPPSPISNTSCGGDAPSRESYWMPSVLSGSRTKSWVPLPVTCPVRSYSDQVPAVAVPTLAIAPLVAGGRLFQVMVASVQAGGPVERRPVRGSVADEQPQRGSLHGTRHAAHGEAQVALLAGAVHVQPGERPVVRCRVRLQHTRISRRTHDHLGRARCRVGGCAQLGLRYQG